MDFGGSGRAQTVAALDHARVAHTRGFAGHVADRRANGVGVAVLGFAHAVIDAGRILARRLRLLPHAHGGVVLNV
jgi:hypothetical protein